MAGWISSKLKVAETLLQQIDQQAAESLGKNDRPRSPPDSLSSSSSSAAPKRSSSSSALSLKFQLPIKPPPPPPLPAGPDPDPDGRLLRKPPPDPDVVDDDWTELLGSPKSIVSPAWSNGASPPHRTAASKKPSPRRGSTKSPAAGVKNPSLQDLRSPPRQSDDIKRVEEGLCVLDGNVTDDGIGRLGAAKSRRAADNVSAVSSSGSGSGSDSASSSDSEDERRRREERRKRRERVMAEKAAEAIKERENVVARLEGEKESLEKILEERERQQAQEASELQTSMIETMEAADLEKQKHNSTRMDALTRVAKLETINTELARALATTQWNLEVEVTRVAELRQQIEAKELALEEHRRRMSKAHQAHQGTRSLSEVESSKRAELEQEILDAEYSLICDKIAKLKEKAKNLEDNIVITRNDIVRPTEVEVELKRRLAQLTDHLIQKQTQVETLSSEKATLVFRMETVSRLLDENSLPLQASDYIDELGSGVAGASERDDIEAGVWQPYNSAPRRALRDRIKSGQRQLGSILWQLDAIFASGLVFLKRNPKAQLVALFYLVCLHLWVTYILMSRSEVSDGASSGAVFSLETINKTSGT